MNNYHYLNEQHIWLVKIKNKQSTIIKKDGMTIDPRYLMSHLTKTKSGWSDELEIAYCDLRFHKGKDKEYKRRIVFCLNLKEMDIYSTYVRENAQKVKKFEELARYGTIVLPKGPLGEVATEGSYAVLGLVGVVNDAIIHGKTKRAGEAWSFAGGEKNYQIRVTSIRALLTFFAHCEALLEVSASKWASPDFRDQLVVSIEVTKAFARLLLLRWFPRECIYAGGKFESFVPPVTDQQAADVVPTSAQAAATTTTTTTSSSSSWTGRRTGLSLRVPQTMQKYLDPTTQSEAMNRELKLRVTAELLHIFRPVIFVVLARRFKNQWWPFLLSLAVDLTSLKLFQTVAKVPSLIPSMLPSSNLSHDATELRRRTFLLLFYLFRTPLYEKTLGAFSTSLTETFKNVPGLATLAELVAFQFEFYHVTHFYSAAS